MKRILAFTLAFAFVFVFFAAVACNVQRQVTVYLHDYDQSGSPKQWKYNPDVDLPAPPTRQGYVFEGWFTDEEHTEPFVPDKTATTDFHLYAKWSKTAHIVTLIFDDGKTPDQTLTVLDGMSATPPDPQRDNYRFDGWYFEDSPATQYTEQPITRDVVLFAKWTPTAPPVKHTITLVCNDGQTPDRTVVAEEGRSATLPVLSRNGYSFDGWYFAQTFADSEQYTDQPINTDVALYAKWTATGQTSQYSVTFVFFGNSKSVKYVETGSAVETPVNPTRTGYNFAGWFCDAEFNSEYADQAIEHDVTLYAKWTSKPCVTLKFLDGATEDKTVYFSVGQTPILPQDPTRSGYNFVAWFVDAECTREYVPAPATESFVLYAKWATQHDEHVFDSYFMFVECSYEGCHVLGRANGDRLYDNMCDFDATKRTSINSHYNACRNALSQTAESFVRALEVFEEDLNYLTGQYYWATLYNNVESFNYASVINCYNENFSRYYRLFIEANQVFADEFWSLYGEDGEEVLAYVEAYFNTNDSEVEEILAEYSQALNGWYGPNIGTINGLYGRLVNAYNREAQEYGYSNYIEYAYKEVYNREYSPSDTEQMHANVKRFIAPALTEVHNKLNRTSAGDSENRNFYSELSDGNIVGNDPSQLATNYVGEYFKWLNANNETAKNIDFYSAVNDMFRVGNYFVGNGEGAYTMYVPYNDVAAIYVQRDSYYDVYDNAFTFVHEFGHYYNYLYNGEKYLSYDHDETHSQGDEMLFLAWLKVNKPQSVSAGMTQLELSQLENILRTICIAAAVDELEQAAYTGEYRGNAVSSDYHALFGEILDSYGTEAAALLKANGNQSYWYYVAFTNAVYYISYAMSALPAVELYTVAQNDGLEAARDTYFKLFTYCNDDQRMENYSYTDVLTYCGLDSPFENVIYTNIADYVDSLCR